MKNPNVPSSGNYELQEEFLTTEQRRISGHLFELGVVSRIIGQQMPEWGIGSGLDELEMLDKVFVPSFIRIRDGRNNDRQLSLTAFTHTEGGRTSDCSYRLGMVDSTDTLFAFSGVNPEDAESVHETARELLRAKADGLIPNLSGDLLSINNLHNAMELRKEN